MRLLTWGLSVILLPGTLGGCGGFGKQQGAVNANGNNDPTGDAGRTTAKETVTIAFYARDLLLEDVIAEFNGQSDRYHVECKVYYDNEVPAAQVKEAYADADLRINADLVSEHTPDLLVLDSNHINVKKFAANGLFEDLKPWLERSERYGCEDYFPQTLKACTYNDTLVAVPKYFALSFIAGKAAELGTKPGWTAAEMLAFAKAHPNAELFDHCTPSRFLELMCYFDMGSYVDWETGECRFDGEEFIRLLELSGLFLQDDADNSWAEDEDATPYKLQDGRVLLEQAGYSDYYMIQDLDADFGGAQICYIGYPNGAGNSGIRLSTSENIAMLAKASHKEGAWAFLEYYLGCEEERENLSFPANKKAFEERTQEVLAGKRYRTDEAGNKMETFGWRNWEYDLHTPTGEETDRVLTLLERAVPVDECDNGIRKIIREETEAYFKGQKSAEAVAKVIQSRAQLYVNEIR